MAHRLAFATNRTVPLAVKVTEPGCGRLYAYDPANGPQEDDDASDHEAYAQIELLALDETPLDGMMVPTGDSLWLRAAFTDPLGRSVEITSTEVFQGTADVQHYGGVATNLYERNPDHAGPSSWYVQALAAWARVEVRVNDALTDKDLYGRVSLVEPVASEAGDLPTPQLSLCVYPKRVEKDGALTSIPMQAAEELGMAGWSLRWSDVDYAQAPVMSVRLEKGDSVEKIAKELTVEDASISRANPSLDLGDPRPGTLLRVPMLVRARSEAPKKVHPSVALTWKEIIKGWTTTN